MRWRRVYFKQETYVEGEQVNSRESDAFREGAPPAWLGSKIQKHRAAAASGTFQPRTDGVAWQDPGRLAQIEHGTHCGPASFAAGRK